MNIRLIKPVTAKLSQGIDKVRLHIFSDWHIGDGNCDMSDISRQIGEVLTDDNAYCILNGDLINNAIRSSISDVYSESASPMEAIQTLSDILRPLAEKGKILFATTGNHEFRSYKESGIDIMALVCRELGIQDKYRSDGGILYLSFGINAKRKAEGRRTSYTVFVTHGNGGGSTVGGKASKLEKASAICDADLFIVSHTHTPITFKDSFIRCYPCSDGIEVVERTYINTSASLDYGGYGMKAMFRPASKANPVAILDGSRKNISVSL